MQNSCFDNSNINYYGSAVLSDGTTHPPGVVPSSPIDSVMSQVPDPHKRPISEVSSDDAVDNLFSSDSSSPSKVKIVSKKQEASKESKKSVFASASSSPSTPEVE